MSHLEVEDVLFRGCILSLKGPEAVRGMNPCPRVSHRRWYRQTMALRTKILSIAMVKTRSHVAKPMPLRIPVPRIFAFRKSRIPNGPIHPKADYKASLKPTSQQTRDTGRGWHTRRKRGEAFSRPTSTKEGGSRSDAREIASNVQADLYRQKQGSRREEPERPPGKQGENRFKPVQSFPSC